MKNSAKVPYCSILVCIAEWWSSSLSSRNPKTNWCLSRIYGVRLKDRGLSTGTVIRTSRRIRGLFCMERLRTLNSYQIFKIKNKKIKTYSGWCPFKGLSNDTTLLQIQSGRTVPLTQIIVCKYVVFFTKCCHVGAQTFLVVFYLKIQKKPFKQLFDP